MNDTSDFVAHGHDFVTVEVASATLKSADMLRERWRDELEARWRASATCGNDWRVPIVLEAPAFSTDEVAEWEKAWNEARPTLAERWLVEKETA